MTVVSRIKHKLIRVLGGSVAPSEPPKPFYSVDFWESRYQGGGNSGGGSYGKLADFKAEVLNQFVKSHDVKSVIEFGCGDGHQLTLADYPAYIGLDVSPTAINLCKKRFADDRSKSFFLYDSLCFVDRAGVFKADLSMSLDVIFHIVEDRIFEQYMAHLFDSATRYVIVYSSNKLQDDPGEHVRHRVFTDWVDANRPTWNLEETIPNRYPYATDPTGSFSDFYIFSRT